jgi:uncharacterized protein
VIIITQKDNTLAIITHIIGIFSNFIGSLIIFILTQDKEIKKHARNALNWQISLGIYSVLIYILSVYTSFIINLFPKTKILFPFTFTLSVLTLLNIIFCIVAAVKANENIIWKYPLSINFIKKIGERNIEKGKKELKRAYEKVTKKIKKEFKK